MTAEEQRKRKISVPQILMFTVELMLMIYWVYSLWLTEANRWVYITIAVLGACAMCFGKPVELDKRLIPTLIFAVIFSILQAAANYELYWVQTYHTANVHPTVTHIVSAPTAFVCLVIAGIPAFFHIVCFLVTVKIPGTEKRLRSTGMCVACFLASFGILLTAYLVFLVRVAYPAIVIGDATWQYNMIYHIVNYSNHHPFFHTQLMHVFIKLGGLFTADPNVGVFLYGVFSCVLVAAVSAYAAETLYQSGVSVAWPVVITAIMLCPHNVYMTAIVTKDIPFAACVVMMVVALFRMCRGLSMRFHIDEILYVVGAVGMGIFRSNGWLSLLGTGILFLFMLKKNYIKVMTIVVIIVTYLMTSIVPTLAGADKAAISEALSMPLQQMGRVWAEIADDPNRDFTEEEAADYLKVFKWYEGGGVSGGYQRYISDPVKGQAEHPWISENKGEFLRIYLTFGMHYPIQYLKAYIDQVRGYIDAAYCQYTYYSEYFVGADMTAGEVHIYHDPATQSLLLTEWLNSERDHALTLVFASDVGLYFWWLFILLFVSVMRGAKMHRTAILVPFVFIALTLMMASPCALEVRYAYAVLMGMPVVTGMMLSSRENDHGIQDAA